MSDNLVSFLVENNYAPNGTSALKILCCISSSFYEDLVCEASQSELRGIINGLRSKISAGRGTPQDEVRLRKAQQDFAALSSGENKPKSKEPSEADLEDLIKSVQSGSRTEKERKTAKPEHTMTGGGYAQTGRRGRIGPDVGGSAGSTSNIQPGTRTVFVNNAGKQVQQGTPGARRVQVGGSAAGEVIRGRFGDVRGRSQGGATTPKNPTVR